MPASAQVRGIYRVAKDSRHPRLDDNWAGNRRQSAPIQSRSLRAKDELVIDEAIIIKIK